MSHSDLSTVIDRDWYFPKNREGEAVKMKEKIHTSRSRCGSDIIILSKNDNEIYDNKKFDKHFVTNELFARDGSYSLPPIASITFQIILIEP